MNKKKILLTNDDGFDSLGLTLLRDRLSLKYDTTIIAPANEKSACSHSLTIKDPLKLIKVDEGFYKVIDGTPTDCIHLAFRSMFKPKDIDLVVSGINYGSNMGEDVTYSGTVGASIEAVLNDVPSIAISNAMKCSKKDFKASDFNLALDVADEIIEKIFFTSFPISSRKILNLNVPHVKAQDYKGAMITSLGHRLYNSGADERVNPRGDQYYWLGDHPLEWQGRGELICDFDAVNKGHSSLTPITLDMTSYKDIDLLNDWIK